LLLRLSGRRELLLLLGLTLTGSLAEGAGLLLLLPLLNMIGVGGQAPPASGLLVGGLGFYLLLVTAAAGIVAVRGIMAPDMRNRFIDRLRSDLHGALLHVSWPVFQNLRATDVKHILIAETSRIGMCHTQLLGLLVSGLTIPVMLIAALVMSPLLTLLTLLVAAGALLLIRRIGRSGFGLGMRMGQAMMAMTADLTDDLSGLRLIKGFGAQEIRRSQLERRFADIRHLQRRQTRIQVLEHAALTVAAALVAVVAILTAVLWAHLQLATAMVVILAFARLAQQGLGSIRVWRQLEAGLPAVLVYEEMLARLCAGAEPSVGAGLPALSQSLAFQGVSWRTTDGRQALDGVNLVLPFGSLLAVTGPSGAGKSTLADLAAGLAQPTAGRLCVDGWELTPDLLPAWRQQVAVVPQDPFLFHDTIRANLLLAAPQATEADLWAALEEAAAVDFVRALPRGLDTVVGDRGNSVSGGERQRLAIARAMLRHPRLLILDEATSALDAGSEAMILRTLDRLRGHVTILAVTHRDATRRAADHVLELEAGRVVGSARGSHLAL